MSLDKKILAFGFGIALPFLAGCGNDVETKTEYLDPPVYRYEDITDDGRHVVLEDRINIDNIVSFDSETGEHKTIAEADIDGYFGVEDTLGNNVILTKYDSIEAPDLIVKDLITG